MVVVILLAAGLTGCIRGNAGSRCRTTEFGEDGGAWILQCKNGRWQRLMTKQDYLLLLLALKAQNEAGPVAPAPTQTSLPQPTPPSPNPITSSPWN